ncbi:hypothetical protein [Gynurincola endophyticus]|uniref:hypothetical protein n=1 Tax=Gynurincola endophyticus TaxID=2479004 RepID=UPI000F8E1D98|nr:hypothetical protein [Gynurincola endophyticus]
MRTISIVAGLLFFVGSLLIILGQREKLNVFRNGTIVSMRIEKLPLSCLGSRVRYFVDYSYEGKTYAKATRGRFCESHKVGDLIEMKYLSGSDIILHPNESVIQNIISFILLGLFGLSIFLVYLLKK